MTGAGANASAAAIAIAAAPEYKAFLFLIFQLLQ
jgi:hypothetical protein